MKCPLVIGGNEILRSQFTGTSPFYEGYSYSIANAGLLEIATAIGCARRAERGSLESRTAWLQKAADLFAYQDADLEHAVRMLGMPISQVKALFDDIPGWMREVPRILAARFEIDRGSPNLHRERLHPKLHKLLQPPEGYCYAVTPGNDPRASALVVANLCFLGIPFILKASSKDALAPLVIKALIQAGFDPNYCNLLYFEGGERGERRESEQKHHKLVDGSAIVWTFGPASSIDEIMRYERRGKYATINLSGIDVGLDAEVVRKHLAERGFDVFVDKVDHFAGKQVIKHDSGNCAAIFAGGLSKQDTYWLHEAIAFPLGCTGTKSLFLVNSPEKTVEALAASLSELVTGNPLDPATQIGYIHPKNLDYLQRTAAINGPRIHTYGGERISVQQARPLLVATQDDVPDFFGHEIPAYVLAVRTCTSVDEAVELINGYTSEQPRLAVSFHHVDRSAFELGAAKVKAHTILLNKPTTKVMPFYHEGNDYIVNLMRGKLLIE